MLLVLAWGLCTIAGGCGSDDVSGKIAVVDLDEIARQMGRDEKFKAALREKEAELNNRLAELQRSLNAQYQQQAQYGFPSTEFRSRMNARLSQAQADARKELADFKQSLIAEFRGEVAPVAREIAAERGLGVVVPKNDNFLLTFEPGVDITPQVAERLKNAAPQTVEQISDAGSETKRQ
jgi:Skp family chaperone for outer membrane proteins